MEILCALYRKQNAGDIKRGGARTLFRRFLTDCNAGRIILIPYGGAVVERAERILQTDLQSPNPVLIRSLDLIHLASAMSAHVTTLVATDMRLREIARRNGLKLLP